MQNFEKPEFHYQPPNTLSHIPSLTLPNDGHELTLCKPFILTTTMLKRSASQPTTTSPLFTVDCRPTYASILKNKLTETKRTKATQTNDTDFISTEECEWFGSMPSTTSHPTFPINNYPMHYPRLLAPPEQLNFALYPPTRFPEKTWEKMWGEGTLVLDLFVTATAPTLSDICHSPSDTYFQHETTEFTRFDYCVQIDENWCHKPLVIKTGDIVNIFNTNTQQSRYVVDLCQMIRDGRAYLPVHYCDYYGQGFTKSEDPCHPSFILDIPTSFCHSLVAVHLWMNSAYYASLQSPSVTVLPNCMIPSMKFWPLPLSGVWMGRSFIFIIYIY